VAAEHRRKPANIMDKNDLKHISQLFTSCNAWTSSDSIERFRAQRFDDRFALIVAAARGVEQTGFKSLIRKTSINSSRGSSINRLADRSTSQRAAPIVGGSIGSRKSHSTRSFSVLRPPLSTTKSSDELLTRDSGSSGGAGSFTQLRISAELALGDDSWSRSLDTTPVSSAPQSRVISRTQSTVVRTMGQRSLIDGALLLGVDETADDVFQRAAAAFLFETASPPTSPRTTSTNTIHNDNNDNNNNNNQQHHMTTVELLHCHPTSLAADPLVNEIGRFCLPNGLSIARIDQQDCEAMLRRANISSFVVTDASSQRLYCYCLTFHELQTFSKTKIRKRKAK
jgi:hypothetical protein